MAVRSGRLYVPALGGLYESLWSWSEALLRIVAGLMLLYPHGLPKLGLFGGAGFAGTSQFLATKVGMYPGAFWAGVAIFLETIGGILLAVGLFTRLIALLLTIEMIVILWYYYSIRAAYTSSVELPLLWAFVFFYFVVRGGGAYSVDARMKKEF
jgi:putative oxidoreductase